MTWDKTVPAGSDSARDGDDAIRELKTDLEDALTEEHTFPVAAGAPKAYHKIPNGNTAGRPAFGNTGRLYINTQLGQLEYDNGTGWAQIGISIESGTKMVFFQAAAPTFWTIDATHNGKLLRVVSATGGGSGGSDDPSTTITLAHTHSVNGHSHSISSDGSHGHTVDNHTHSTPAHTHKMDFTNVNSVALDTGAQIGFENDTLNLVYQIIAGAATRRHMKAVTLNEGSGTSGGATPTTDSQGAHTHTGATGSATSDTDSQLTNVTLAYINVIVCTKD